MPNTTRRKLKTSKPHPSTSKSTASGGSRSRKRNHASPPDELGDRIRLMEAQLAVLKEEYQRRLRKKPVKDENEEEEKENDDDNDDVQEEEEEEGEGNSGSQEEEDANEIGSGRSVSASDEGYDFGLVDIEHRMINAALDSDEDSGEDTCEDDDDNHDEEYYQEAKGEGKKLLSLARKDKAEEMIRMLDENCSLIRSRNSAGDTALHLAARSGHLKTVKKLIRFILKQDEKNTISIMETNIDRDTALHVALQEGHEEVASYLIQKHPEAAYEFNKVGVTPLYLAVKSGYKDMVRELFEVLPGNEVPKSKKTKLLQGEKVESVVHAAIRAKNIEILGMLLDHLPNLVNATNEKGWKPLSYAAYKGYRKEVSYLLQNFKGCDEERDADGFFPIHRAVVGGHASTLAEFASHCPEKIMYQKTKEKQTILHLAVIYGRYKILDYLNKEHEDKVIKMMPLRDKDGNTYKDIVQRSKR